MKAGTEAAAMPAVVIMAATEASTVFAAAVNCMPETRSTVEGPTAKVGFTAAVEEEDSTAGAHTVVGTGKFLKKISSKTAGSRELSAVFLWLRCGDG
jgi:uncharacterized protein with LGFP repeats